MKIYPLVDEKGNVRAFEVPNWKVSRARATNIVDAIPGVRTIKKPVRSLSWFREETFCEFSYGGYIFEISEPFGDNSRFCIGAKENGGWSKELEVIMCAFKQAW